MIHSHTGARSCGGSAWRLAFVVGLLALTTLQAAEPLRLVVGATPVPAGELLEFIRPALATRGVGLEVKIFTDYIQPNVQLAEGRLDANLYQHRPFLEEFNRQKHADLVAVARIYLAPLGGYSRRVQSLAALSEGASVAIPNDPTNSARALQLLAANGLITLRPEAGTLATIRDIAANPRHLKIRELEAAMLPRVLREVDLAVINTNYALEAKLDPVHDALFREDRESPYANVLVTRASQRDMPAIKILTETLLSPATAEFLREHYKGAIIPTF